MDAKSPHVSDIGSSGTSAVTTADAGQVASREVTALYEAHALSLTRLAYVVLGDRQAARMSYRCVTDAIISPDGSPVVCGYGTLVQHSKTSFTSATGFIRYSTSTGKPVAVLGVYAFHGQEPGGDTSLFWVNSTGKILIGSVGTPRGIQVCVINGQTMTPLPGLTDLNIAAW